MGRLPAVVVVRVHCEGGTQMSGIVLVRVGPAPMAGMLWI